MNKIKIQKIKKNKIDYNNEYKNNKQKKSKNIFAIVLCCISIFGLIYSLSNIAIWKKDNNQVKNQISDIDSNVVINEIEDNENTEIIEQENVDKFNPYWDYIKMNLIDVDFSSLKKENNQTVGWLQVGGTNINYPFVQAKDNEYYLNHAYNKKYNQAGWAFMDYRNDNKDYDKNTIIYGHALKSGAIFGTLKYILKDKWIKNTSNHIIKLSTPSENTLWQVFSIYTIPNTSDYLQVEFVDDEDFLSFGEMLIERSIHNFNTPIYKNDKILTLSSCYKTSDNKIVLHAKLIKKEKR